MHDVAVPVGQDLDLDMARVGEVLLHIDRVVAERGSGLACAPSDQACDSSFVDCATFMPVPPPPAAALISTGIADLLGDRAWRLGLDRAVASRGPRDAERPAASLACTLSPIMRICSGARADEGEAVLLHHLGELGVLRQEAVAGMDRVGAGDGRRRERIAGMLR